MFQMPFKVYIDLYGNLISTGVIDTTLSNNKETNQFNTTSIGLGGSIKLKSNFISKKKSHFDLIAGYNYYQLYNTSNNFVTNGGPIFSPENNPENNVYYTADNIDAIHKYEFVIRYCKDYEKQDNAIFLRVLLHQNRISREYKELNFKHNTHLQVQLGYSASIEDIFSSKGTGSADTTTDTQPEKENGNEPKSLF
jgi:hypothetical protein